MSAPVNFVTYDRSTGEIKMIGRCPEESVDHQETANDGVILGDAVHGANYVDVRTKEIKPLPPKPSDSHVFDYSAKQWVFRSDLAWASIRARRARLLADSDWTQLPDVPMATKSAWAAYRQDLRDITGQPDPLRINWPSPPK